MDVRETTFPEMSDAVLVPPLTDVSDGPPAPPADLDRRQRRKKIALLAFLSALLAIFVLVAGWYLVTRKPVTEILPSITEVSLPTYAFSIYGTSNPLGIAVTSSGDRIYVAEMDGDRTVQVFDGKGSLLKAFAPPKSKPADRLPMYVAIEPSSGDVYVSDRIERTINVFDRDGGYRRQFTPRPAIDGWQPLGLAFDATGNLWVGDVGGLVQRIEVFRPDGTLVRSIGDTDEFSFPNGLAIGANGTLLVADGNHGRLAQIDAAGRPLAGIQRGTARGELGLPRGLALDDQGRLYVTDTSGGDVNVYQLQDGQRPAFVGSFAAYGTGDGELRYPGGIASDARGRLYVADWANNRIQVWSY